MEARRYRCFDIWRSRAHMIEINFYRSMLDGAALAMKDWAGTLRVNTCQRVAAYGVIQPARAPRGTQAKPPYCVT